MSILKDYVQNLFEIVFIYFLPQIKGGHHCKSCRRLGSLLSVLFLLCLQLEIELLCKEKNTIKIRSVRKEKIGYLITYDFLSSFFKQVCLGI